MTEELLTPTPIPTPTRQRLLRAAQQLIEEGGYAAAPVAAIAERAGVAAGTLYRHFESKQELFVELFRSVCAREERAMRAAAESMSAAGAVERLEVVLATFAERALRNPRLAWALLAEPVDPLVDAERLAYRERYARVVAETLEQAIAAGEVPPQNVELTAAALVGGCGEALVGPLSPLGVRPDTGRIVTALRTFVRRAVGARPEELTAPEQVTPSEQVTRPEELTAPEQVTPSEEVAPRPPTDGGGP